MAKKIDMKLTAKLVKNTEKGGSWLCEVKEINETGNVTNESCSAWSNASAGKRWVKAWVIANTTRKSIKMEVTKKDLNDKPIEVSGTLTYKVEA